MNDAKQQLADKIKSANNILVTVSRNPTVDQLAALVGLTLLLNKQDKHAVAVFSGQVPSTMEFLQPEETIEKNTDSLRDFIIALDKNKADKLRYKVEDDVVRIFITPYKTSITQADFDFSQGDFNVDVVIALGVQRQEDLDEAITSHGRILHDAAVATIDTNAAGDLGTINWHVPSASSLSEMVTDLAHTLGDKLLDEQISNALLTGIVSATERFSNDKTGSQTMSMSALLIGAGANQQLVASKLQEASPAPDKSSDNKPDASGEPPPGDQPPPGPGSNDGAIDIDHSLPKPIEPAEEHDNPASKPAGLLPPLPPLTPPSGIQPPLVNNLSPGSKMITEPPTLGGALTANTSQAALEPTTDPLSMPTADPPFLNRRPGNALGPPPPLPVTPFTPSPFKPPPPANTLQPSPSPPPPALMPPASLPPKDSVTLSELEKNVDSPHLNQSAVDSARDSVNQALSNSADGSAPDPIQALHAQPLGDDLHGSNAGPPTSQVVITADGVLLPANGSTAGVPAADDSGVDRTPDDEDVPSSAHKVDTHAPPPVPPPIPFQFGTPDAPII